MKKRLLALALCLVLATSLLPITAAAQEPEYSINSLTIKASGVEKRSDGYYHVNITSWEADCDQGKIGDSKYGIKIANDKIYSTRDYLGTPITDIPQKGVTYYLDLAIRNDSYAHFFNPDFLCELEIPGYNTQMYFYYPQHDWIHVSWKLTKIYEHNWRFSHTGSSLTAKCSDPNCAIGEVSVKLNAHSVTLPESPFNAQVILNGITEEQIKEKFGYEISPIRYKFKAPGDSAFTDITPADGAREGTYQAAVTLSPIEVAARYARNDDGTTQGLVTEPDGSITLYTQYTAVNPETTAQTGDNRPIELMMGSVLVFSALAAAAFILDHKRKYKQ